MVSKESCPYCGKLSDMVLQDGVWIPKQVSTCCKKNLRALAASVPELKEAKPNLKSKEVLP